MTSHLDENKLRKLKELQEMGINPFPYKFNQADYAKNINEAYAKLEKEEKTRKKVSVAGRVMLKRIMGKAGFMHIQDQSGRIQIYLSRDNLGEELYRVFAKKVDLGDIIGVEGTIFKTKMGEVTVLVKTAEILCKSLLTLPEKFHGLKDVELKYRQRCLDLIMNPDTKEVFKKRSLMIKEIRDFFHEKGFMEVETPTLQTIYGGANARPFKTHINAWDMDMFLSISPELYLKRLLVGGFEKVFTICKNFRNEDVDTTHNPEFTMLEIYQSYVDYNTMMEYLEQVFEKACIAMNGSTKVEQMYNDKKVVLDFKAPWERLSMVDAIKKFAKIDVLKMSEKEVEKLIKKHKIDYDGPFSWGLGVQLLFEEFVEDQLVQPVHIIDHPKESTPLCKLYRNDPRLIERFESFCLGMEVSNAYSELNDPVLQRELLECQAAQLRGGSEEAHPMDEDFITAMEYGMPPAGGLGFGIDRMAIILTGVDSIRDVIFFPTMKPKGVVASTSIGKKFKTKRLYFKDHYLKEFDARVLFVEGNKVILDKTAFYVEGGGQAGDSGSISGEIVMDTQKIDDNHVHILKNDSSLTVGDEVHGVVDWERRYRIMRLHSASHIVGYFLFKEFGELKLLNTFVNDTSDESVYELKRSIDEKKIKEVEKKANSFIKQKNKIEMVEDKKRSGYMWWVCDEIKEACGGTHVKNTSEIGMIKLTAKKEGGKLAVVTKFAK